MFCHTSWSIGGNNFSFFMLGYKHLAELLWSSIFEPNHAAGVKLIFLILTVASAGILFYYVTAALKMSKRKPYG